MLFGQPPYGAQDKEQLFDNILNQQLVIDRTINNISLEAEDLLTKLLDRDPKRRIGSSSIQ